MKKIISVFLILIMLFAAVACDTFGGGDNTSYVSPPQTKEAGDTREVTTSPAETLPDIAAAVKPNKGGLILNEAMASNKSVIFDDYGEYSDWIELYNDGEAEISLKNYFISDSPDNKTKGVLPDIRIGAKQYLIIWASGRNVYNAETNSLHLPFKLSKAGETVSLFSMSGSELGRITLPEMPSDISAGPDDDGNTFLLAEPTPGEKNVTAKYVKPVQNDEPINQTDKTVNTIRINEYTTKKTVTFTDSEGDYGAWVEIYNFGEKEVKLKGLFLSDDEAEFNKWGFPDITLAAGSYMTVFMMGKEKEYTAGGEVQATFTLSGKEEKLGIYNGKGDVIDSCAVYELESNMTCGRDPENPDKWLFFPRATKNAKNTVPGFEDIESARYPKYKTAYINEVVAVNATLESSPDGKTYSSGELYDYYDLYDYIELHNPTENDVDLSDFYIGKSSFDKAVWLPTVKLRAGGYKLIYFADETRYDSKNDNIYVDLGLNRYRNDIYLFDRQGCVVDNVNTSLLYDKTSAGRRSDTDDSVYYFTSVTPGKENTAVPLSKAVAAPSFSLEGGYVEAGENLTITVPEGCIVYYTTDGSKPTQNGTLYRAPIAVDKTMTVRARAFKSNALPSDEISVSFIVGRKHNMPDVFLCAEATDLFSPP